MSYINRPNHVNEIGIKETNNLGYRNRKNYYSIFDSTDSSIKVLIIGGSTTWGYYIDDPSYTWPAQLELLLTKYYPKKDIQVINAGILYGTSVELLSHYIYKNRYLNPDIVIIHTGGNDVVPLLFHDYNPDYSEFRNINFDLHSLRRGELFLIKNSNIIKSIYTSWLGDKLSIPHLKSDYKSLQLDQEYYLKNVEKNHPIGFKRNLEILIQNIILDSASPILFPFYMLDSDSLFDQISSEAKQLSAYTLNSREATKKGIKKHKLIMRNLSNKYNIPYYELENDIIPPKYWFDHCHLKPEGENIKSEFIFKNVKKDFDHIFKRNNN